MNKDTFHSFLTNQMVQPLRSLYIEDKTIRSIISYFTYTFQSEGHHTALVQPISVLVETNGTQQDILIKTKFHSWEFDEQGRLLSQNGLTNHELQYQEFQKNPIFQS